MYHKISVLVLFLSIYFIDCFASFEFLLLDTNARTAALGGAFIGICDDVNSINYNPAGLGRINTHQISFMYNRHFQDVNQIYIAFGHKNKFGFSINYLDYGGIQRTTLSNPTGSGLTQFSIRNYAVSFAYGEKIYTEHFAEFYLGGNLKYVHEQIDTIHAYAIGIDVGILYQTFLDNLWLGVVLQNIGTTTMFKTLREELPLNLRFGIGYYPINDKLLFTFDFVQPKDKKFVLLFGSEYRLLNSLVLRCGFNSKNEADIGISVGAGIKYKTLSVDYSFTPYGDLGTKHIISLLKRI